MRYLLFSIDRLNFVIQTDQVVKILPCLIAEPNVEKMIYRGNVLKLYPIRKRLEINSEQKLLRQTRIVLVKTSAQQEMFGLVVDAVHEIVSFELSNNATDQSLLGEDFIYNSQIINLLSLNNLVTNE
jgi:chemotaxis signal transduction protein